VSLAVALGAGRLKRHEADIEGLKTVVSSLVNAKGPAESQIGGIDNGLYAALFNAGARELEMERLSNFYESLANRIASLEVLVNSRDKPPPTDMVDRGEQQQTVLPDGSKLVATFEQLVRRDRWKIFGKFSKSRGYFNQLVQQHNQLVQQLTQLVPEHSQVAQEYVRVVKERDALLDARDEWFRERQSLVRQKGPARQSSNSLGVAFPPELRDLYEPLSVCVIDVGAQNLTSEDHVYSPLVNSQAARVIGFEPLKGEASTRSAKDPNVIMLNHFVGEGGEGIFRVGKFNPTSSLLEPNQAFLSQFVSLSEMCEIVSEEPIETTRLDDLPEVRDCDFLKIDVQGGELGVLRGAAELLESTIVVHSEVEFAPIYKDQPLFSDVDAFLRAHEFELIDVTKTGYAAYDDLPRPIASSRLMWADAVYFKSPERLSACGPKKLMRAAYIAHVNYGMYDLAARYLRHLDEMVGSETRRTYGEKLCEIKLSS
jgi:FkbM family methyltransferase